MIEQKTQHMVTQTGAAVAVAGGLTLNEWLAVGGLLVAVISAIYNVWHTSQLRKIARDRRVFLLDDDAN